MAQPTSSHGSEPERQAPTPGVSPRTHGAAAAGLMSAPASAGVHQTPDTPGAPPVLFEEIDPVLLVRLYPHAASGEAARAEAEKAGAKAHEDGMKLVAAQQEPVAAPAA